MEQNIIPQTVGYPISNTAPILEFTDGVLPKAPNSFFPHDQVNHNLTTIFNSMTYLENRATQRILDNYRFRRVLEDDSPALLKMNVRSPQLLASRCTSALSVMASKVCMLHRSTARQSHWRFLMCDRATAGARHYYPNRGIG